MKRSVEKGVIRVDLVLQFVCRIFCGYCPVIVCLCEKLSLKKIKLVMLKTFFELGRRDTDY